MCVIFLGIDDFKNTEENTLFSYSEYRRVDDVTTPVSPRDHSSDRRLLPIVTVLPL
jgi:hypothetical protein